jgi:hypothetical protein
MFRAMGVRFRRSESFSEEVVAVCYWYKDHRKEEEALRKREEELRRQREEQARQARADKEPARTERVLVRS